MKKRRFSITQNEGELIRLALSTYIDFLSSLIEKDESYTEYYAWRLTEAQLLRDKVSRYQWEVF